MKIYHQMKCYISQQRESKENDENYQACQIILKFIKWFGVQFNLGNMSKQSQKKFVEINHALSGYHGQEVKVSAYQIYETRKDILKKLQRQKKLAAVISDELYSYLEKYPEQKLGLHQQSFKKKKTTLLEADQKIVYASPAIEFKYQGLFSDYKNNSILYPFMKQTQSSQQSVEN